MSNLTEFLLARIAEDEAVARDAIEERSQTQFVVPLPPDYADFGFQSWPDVGVPSVLVGPERVLAECEAKRRIVERCSAVDVGMPSTHLAQGILAEMAAAHADHPDYREEWKL